MPLLTETIVATNKSNSKVIALFSERPTTRFGVVALQITAIGEVAECIDTGTFFKCCQPLLASVAIAAYCCADIGKRSGAQGTGGIANIHETVNRTVFKKRFCFNGHICKYNGFIRSAQSKRGRRSVDIINLKKLRGCRYCMSLIIYSNYNIGCRRTVLQLVVEAIRKYLIASNRKSPIRVSILASCYSKATTYSAYRHIIGFRDTKSHYGFRIRSPSLTIIAGTVIGSLRRNQINGFSPYV